MIRTAISAEAFEVIAKTLPFGDVGYERDLNAQGERLEPRFLDRLKALRERGESYSDVILRLVEVEARVHGGAV